jgi:GNAT superfamily N-acetyltransferase
MFKIEKATKEDIPGIIEVEKSAWGDLAATEEMFEVRIETFPEGVLVAKEKSGKIIGVVVVCIRHYPEEMIFNPEVKALNWFEATGNGFIKSVHDLSGNVGYGVDLSVHQAYTRKGVGQDLIRTACKKLSRHFNVKYGLIGARMPGYAAYAKTMTPEQYIKATKAEGIPLDDELAFFLSVEYKGIYWKIARLIPDYFPDPASLGYGVLLFWKNPFFKNNLD